MMINKIISLMMSMPDYVGSNGRNINDINQAEKKLGVKFAEDYYIYLKEIGLASFNGHELTGLSDSARLNVYDVTIEERENNPEVPHNFYVVEQTNYDDIVFWQNEVGEVFVTQPNILPRKLYNSFIEYLRNL